jgi:hypothetical protein
MGDYDAGSRLDIRLMLGNDQFGFQIIILRLFMLLFVFGTPHFYALWPYTVNIKYIESIISIIMRFCTVPPDRFPYYISSYTDTD